MAAEILVLYYSAGGSVRQMAELIAQGVERVDGAQARLRTVPRVSSGFDQKVSPIPSDGPPYCEMRDLAECSGLALGSPTMRATARSLGRPLIDNDGAARAADEIEALMQ